MDNTGATDAGPNLQIALNALAGTGQAAWLPPGTYQTTTPITVPSGSYIVGSPGTIIKSTLGATGGGFAHSVFIQTFVTGAATTLTGAPVIGSRTLPVTSTAGLAIGQTILVSAVADSGLTSQQFTIDNIVGLNVTTDDPVEFSFLNLDTVSVLTSHPHDITLERLTFAPVSGDRAFEFNGAANCIARQLTVSAANGTFGATGGFGSFDVGGRDNLIDDCHGDGGGGCTFGWALESNVRSTWSNSTAQRVTGGASGYGFWAPTGARLALENCKAWNCTTGGVLSEASASSINGCLRCSVTDSAFYDNGNGLAATSCPGLSLTGSAADFNSSSGFTFSSSASAGGCSVVAADLKASGNAGSGLTLAGGGNTVNVAGLKTNLNAGPAASVANVSDVLIIEGIMSDDDALTAASGAALNVSAGMLKVKGGRLRYLTTASLWEGASASGSATTSLLDLDGVIFENGGGSGTSLAIDCNLGNYRVRDCSSRGALTYGLYANNGVACVLRQNGLCDFSSCGTPVMIDATCLSNRGNVTTTTVVSFPIQAGENISLQPNAATSAAYISARTNGTSFAVTCAASTDYVVS